MLALLETDVRAHAAALRDQVLAYQLFNSFVNSGFTDPSGDWVLLWLGLKDANGHAVGSEPGLAIAQRTGGAASLDGWQITYPGDPAWAEALAALPQGLLPEDVRAHYAVNPAKSAAAVEPKALGGYLLPWPGGFAKRLEASVGHWEVYSPPSCYTDFCRYAYDFTDETMFPLVASRGGTVYTYNDNCANGNPSCTNYLLLYSADTGSYQIYWHLAYNSIPAALHAYGARVNQGQFIGIVDDTGYSTNHHLHFHVAYSITNAQLSWGPSIDIRFADVAINNGTPRTCVEVGTGIPIYSGATECQGDITDPTNPDNDWFFSGQPEAASLTRPAGQTVAAIPASTLIDVSAQAPQPYPLRGVQFAAYLNGEWRPVGPLVTDTVSPQFYDWDVDACAAQMYNGDYLVGLIATDIPGNQTVAISQRTIVSTTPACRRSARG